jgi:hypothetical protein
LPDGSRRKNPVKDHRENISVLQNTESRLLCTVPPRHEGRIAIVTIREAGCGGRFGDARDVIVRTNGAEADGEVAWS